MKRYIGVLIPAVGFIVSAGIAAWLIHGYMPVDRLIYLILPHRIIRSVVLAVMLCLLIAAVAVGIKALRDRDGRFNRKLLTLALLPILPGGLAVYERVESSRSFLSQYDVITFAVRAPLLIEASLIAAMTFLISTVAMTFRALSDRRG